MNNGMKVFYCTCCRNRIASSYNIRTLAMSGSGAHTMEHILYGMCWVFDYITSGLRTDVTRRIRTTWEQGLSHSNYEM